MTRLPGAAVAVIALALIGGAGWFYLASTKVDVSSFSGIEKTVKALQVLERDLTVEVVKVNSNPRADFDTLARLTLETRAQRSHLKELVDATQDLSTEDHSTLLAFVSMLEAKEERVERFKSGYAIVRNSKRYLPQAAREAIEAAQGDDAKDIEAVVLSETKDLQAYLDNPVEVDRQRIMLSLDALRKGNEQRPRDTARKIDTFTAHATVLLQQKGPLDKLMGKVNDTRISTESKRLASMFTKAYEAVRKTKSQYEIYTWALGISSIVVLLLGATVTLVIASQRTLTTGSVGIAPDTSAQQLDTKANVRSTEDDEASMRQSPRPLGLEALPLVHQASADWSKRPAGCY